MQHVCFSKIGTALLCSHSNRVQQFFCCSWAGFFLSYKVGRKKMQEKPSGNTRSSRPRFYCFSSCFSPASCPLWVIKAVERLRENRSLQLAWNSYWIDSEKKSKGIERGGLTHRQLVQWHINIFNKGLCFVPSGRIKSIAGGTLLYMH